MVNLSLNCLEHGSFSVSFHHSYATVGIVNIYGVVAFYEDHEVCDRLRLIMILIYFNFSFFDTWVDV